MCPFLVIQTHASRGRHISHRARFPPGALQKEPPSLDTLDAIASSCGLFGGRGSHAVCLLAVFGSSSGTTAAEHMFHARVSIQKFRRIYFPHPGCEAEQLTLTRGTGPDTRPVATVQKMRIIGRYVDLLFRPHHLAHIQVDGLYVRIPKRPDGGSTKDSQPSGQSSLTASNMSVRLITADGAVLEFANPQGKNPLRLEIHKLRTKSVSAGNPMNYQVRMWILDPPGEGESEGMFGPWQSGKIGKIALRGTAQLRDAKLGKYSGIGGTIQFEEKFSGTLDRINVDRQAHAPDFRVKSAGHPIEMTSQFEVTVNGLRGEARLTNVTANVRGTTLQVHGTVAENPDPDIARRHSISTFLEGERKMYCGCSATPRNQPGPAHRLPETCGYHNLARPS
jgi:hypothetical protein